MTAAKVELPIKVLNLVTIVGSAADIVSTMTSLSFWERQIIALWQPQEAENYIINHCNLVYICGIPALTSDNTMNEPEQSDYEQLSKKEVNKYKRTRHVLTWKQWYKFLKLTWSKEKTLNLTDTKNLYFKATIIDEYITRSSKNIFQKWEFYKLLEDLDLNSHNWYREMWIHMNYFWQFLVLYFKTAYHQSEYVTLEKKTQISEKKFQK